MYWLFCRALGLRFSVNCQSQQSIVKVIVKKANSQQPTTKVKVNSQSQKKIQRANQSFCIFAPLFRRKAGQRFFIEKKASFRLSVSVNLDHSRMLVRISEIKLAYECFCQIRIGGACSSVNSGNSPVRAVTAEAQDFSLNLRRRFGIARHPRLVRWR